MDEGKEATIRKRERTASQAKHQPTPLPFPLLHASNRSDTYAQEHQPSFPRNVHPFVRLLAPQEAGVFGLDARGEACVEHDVVPGSLLNRSVEVVVRLPVTLIEDEYGIIVTEGGLECRDGEMQS
jgi:hypothetical protein